MSRIVPNEYIEHKIYSNVSKTETHKKRNPNHTHSTLVTALTWPSSHRTVLFVSKSHIRAEPSARPAATKRPVGSNLEKEACEYRDVWTAVG